MFIITLGASQVMLVVKNLPASVVDEGLIPEPGTSPGVGKDTPLQYSFLENYMDREAWQATACGAAKSRTRLSEHITLKICLSDSTCTTSASSLLAPRNGLQFLCSLAQIFFFP